MTNALTILKTTLPTSEKALRAAQYVRMSKDKQRYSIENQAAVIAAYAHARSLKIVQTYSDEGESGLHIKNRTGLRDLIRDVCAGEADFGHLLVYDVSRWGRFQDTDESAHYEFICKQAGVKVEYCAEQFDNDGSMLSSIVKNLKRVMAAEYSRELSVKVHAGQSRIVRLGFRHGGPIGYGLQRELVDEKQRHKGFLAKGENKSLQTDRVRTRPGTAQEIATVRWIFEQCLGGKSDAYCAVELERRGVPTGTGRAWKRDFVRRILGNEAYIGNIVYNRHSRKLGGRNISNSPDLWVRGEGCLDSIIEPEVFRRVKKIIEDRRIEIEEDEMLLRLRRTLYKNGRLSTAIIDNTSGLPGVNTYINHFGSVRNAYRLIGYTPKRDHTFIDAAQTWAEAIGRLVQEVAIRVKKSRRYATIRALKDQLRIDGKVDALFCVAKAHPRQGQLTQWRIPRLRKKPTRWIVAIRLAEDNRSVLDYVTLPTNGLSRRFPVRCMWLTDQSPRARLRFTRFETAEALARGIASADNHVVKKA